MLLSRGAPLARRLLCQAVKSSPSNVVVSRMHIKAGYRHPVNNNTPYVNIAAEVSGALVWWWIFWHAFTEYDSVTGEYPYPDPSKWTDEELGVPPDNYVPPNRQ